MAPNLTVLVTIHGIGFQQPPDGDTPGYADGLHDRLTAALPNVMGGDPASEFGRPAGTGAVYVHSDWPPDSRNTDGGLARLGVWSAGDASHRELDISKAPLRDGDRPLAHVALVYSHLEDQGTHIGASLETFARAVVSHGHYASMPSIVGMGVSDTWAAFAHRQAEAATPTPSLHVRARPGSAQAGSSGSLSVIGQLDRDVSTYICRNDLRERVRSFVHEAILRICCREDVANVVINAHSQGTVLAYDVARELAPFAAGKVKLLVTAGSPLRKYATLFYWGTDAACISGIPWRNFWDETDPVADPLAPPLDWRRGHAMPAATGKSELYQAIDPDSGTAIPVAMVDYRTDNVAHGSGGGLPAHNYWDNGPQFVDPLAAMLKAVVAGTPIT